MLQPPANGQVQLSPSHREEISSWRFLDLWSVYVPWHRAMAGRCVVHESCGDHIFSEYRPASQISLNISTKEMLALIYALVAAREIIRNCRVDVADDSQVVILHLKVKVVKLLMSSQQLIKIYCSF